MLDEPHLETTLSVQDLRQVAFVDAVARSVKAGDIIEYWKSSPYLLNS